MNNLIAAGLSLCLCVAVCTSNVAAAEEAAAVLDELKVLALKVKADKKQFIAANLELSDSEAQAFWPLFDEYQTRLAQLNRRLTETVIAYAAVYNDGSLSDAQALELTNAAVAVENDEAAMRKEFIPRLAVALPGRKVARYMQIESKIRAIVRAELAGDIPLVM